MSFFDKLKNLFGGQSQPPQGPAKLGDDLQYPVSISADQAARGTTLELRLQFSNAALNETLSVKVPPGVREAMKLRVPGKGHPGTAGRGDLYVVLHVTPVNTPTTPASPVIKQPFETFLDRLSQTGTIATPVGPAPLQPRT